MILLPTASVRRVIMKETDLNDRVTLALVNWRWQDILQTIHQSDDLQPNLVGRFQKAVNHCEDLLLVFFFFSLSKTYNTASLLGQSGFLFHSLLCESCDSHRFRYTIQIENFAIFHIQIADATIGGSYSPAKRSKLAKVISNSERTLVQTMVNFFCQHHNIKNKRGKL